MIAVGAVDGAKRLASYSNYGSWVDLVAPGGDALRDGNGDGVADVVVSTWADDSGDTPRCGLCRSDRHLHGDPPRVRGHCHDARKCPGNNMNLTRFRQYLGGGALTEDLGDSGRDNTYGYGLIDAAKSLDAVTTGTPPTLLSPSPNLLDFSGSVDQKTLTLNKLGDTSLNITSITDNAAWLTESTVTVIRGLVLHVDGSSRHQPAGSGYRLQRQDHRGL